MITPISARLTRGMTLRGSSKAAGSVPPASSSISEAGSSTRSDSSKATFFIVQL
jgi:hypothetical protein